MNEALATFKLKYYIRVYGEMTYAEVVQLAKEAEVTLANLPGTDTAFEHFAIMVRAYWQYAELLAIVNNLSNLDHLEQKHYLCAWSTKPRCVQDKKHFTEELEFFIPRYNRSQYEKERVMCDQINTRFKTYVTPDIVEFMEL